MAGGHVLSGSSDGSVRGFLVRKQGDQLSNTTCHGGASAPGRRCGATCTGEEGLCSGCRALGDAQQRQKHTSVEWRGAGHGGMAGP